MQITIVPGLGGSDNRHWQSIWQDELSAQRFAPSSWDEPDPEDWLRALDESGQQQGPDTVLIAHSLGCIAVAEWLSRNPGGARGALLVAAPDRFREGFPDEAAGFVPLAADRIPVPALMVASLDDPYCAPNGAEGLAEDWGASLAFAGALGHINSTSGVGPWDQGRLLLTAFLAGLGESCPTSDTPSR